MPDSITCRTRCGRMDHGGCGLLVDVQDGRVIGVRPEPEADLSHGHICPKALALPELLNHPQRLKKPLRRIGERGSGQWEEIPWDEALQFAADGFTKIKAEHGSRAVAFCQGAPKGLEHFVLIRLANTFGSPNVVGPQNVCHMPREIAGMHTCGFFPVPDYENKTEAVLVWGSNLTATNEEGIICRNLLSRLKEDHPPLIVVDPRKTQLARQADLHLPIIPGTDLILALGFLNVIITEDLYDHDFVDQWTQGFYDLVDHVNSFTPERVGRVTGLEADDITKAARIFGQARPGVIQWGNGIEQNVYNYDTARALIMLMALGGNLDAPGGNGAPTPPRVARLGEFVRGDLAPKRHKEAISASHGIAPGFVIVPPEQFKTAVLEGEPYPMRGAYVHVSNPVMAWSDSSHTAKALKRLDFLVVTETFMSPTSALADLVFPAATLLEYNDLGHYGLAHGFLLPRPKAIDPPGECRSNLWIMNELAKAMGLGEYWYKDCDDMLAEILRPSGMTYDDLKEAGILRGGWKHYKYRDKGFKTPSGKVELVLSHADGNGLNRMPIWNGPPEAATDNYPLVLTGHKSPRFFCSDHRYVAGLTDKEPHPVVEVNASDAETAGVGGGDEVWVETRHGRIRVRAHVSDNVAPGVVSVVHGWWRPELGPENEESWALTSLNSLTSGRELNRPMGAPNLRGIGARLVRA
jgi:anaerobic selenocysteine-containing dehydrogenase